MPRNKPLAVATVLASALALAACGGPSPKKGAKDPKNEKERGIYTSTRDCSESGRLTAEQCESAIDKAVAEHEKSAPTYRSAASCEKAEGGEGRCERADGDSYRPRLLAFAFTFDDPPVAKPLYATPKNEPGFRLADKTILAPTNDDLRFSKQAVAAYEAAVVKKTRGR